MSSNTTHEIVVPVLPESVADAVVISWYKKVGDFIERDEALVDIETDKVVLEVPSPVAGILTEIIEHDGSTVIGRQKLGSIVESDADTIAKVSAPTDADSSNKISNKMNSSDIIVSPAAKKMLIENNLTQSQVKGSGKGGRILKEDVLTLLADRDAKPPIPEFVKDKLVKENADSPIIPPLQTNDSIHNASSIREQKRVPMTRLRARIAQRLLDAQQNAAILTTFNEVDMAAIMAMRSQYKSLFEKTHDVKLGFMSFFVKAAVEALKQFPAVNASIDGDDIVYHGFFDIGVAVSSPRGLVVPVLKNAENLSMAGIEQTIKNLAIKARDGKLSLDEITGGTFSITNGGVFGSLLSTPILNPPQSAILGMHKIQERPVVENGEIVIRPIMYLALSYDHRIIDGKEAVQFLVAIKDTLEDPSRLLLEI